MSKRTLYGYMIISLSSLSYDVHTKVFSGAVYSIPNSISNIFFGYVATFKIYPCNDGLLIGVMDQTHTQV